MNYFCLRLRVVIAVACFLAIPSAVFSESLTDKHPVYSLVGEELKYDISFLWFDRLAEGVIVLEQGEDDQSFLVTMEAKTLGVAAFFTRNRIEKYKTMMRIGEDGRLFPLWHSTHTLRDKGSGVSEKVTRYTFDYEKQRVRYQKIKNKKASKDRWYDLNEEQPLFDILSALYNLRLGFFGPVGQEKILIPTFHRKGPQDIVVAPLRDLSRKDGDFFKNEHVRTRILVDPSVFGTKGRDIFAAFDGQMRPSRGIIKNVIGLGDVRGTLRY